jgi:hypothetical protein
MKASIKFRRSAILLITLASSMPWTYAQVAKGNPLLVDPTDLQGWFFSNVRLAMWSPGNFAAQSNAADQEGWHKPQSVEQSIDVNGVTRTYLLYIPRSYVPGESALIIAFHGRGGGGPGSAMEQFSKLDEKADREGFAVAYLDGLIEATGTLNWNYYYIHFLQRDPMRFTPGP